MLRIDPLNGPADTPSPLEGNSGKKSRSRIEQVIEERDRLPVALQERLNTYLRRVCKPLYDVLQREPVSRRNMFRGTDGRMRVSLRRLQERASTHEYTDVVFVYDGEEGNTDELRIFKRVAGTREKNREIRALADMGMLLGEPEEHKRSRSEEEIEVDPTSTHYVTFEQRYRIGSHVDEFLKQFRGPKRVKRLRRLAPYLMSRINRIHEKGIIHRDVKPQNILICTDGPAVIDFGSAKYTDDRPGASHSYEGSTGFMAPETTQAGLLPDPRQDIYSLGKIFLKLGKNAAANEENSPAPAGQAERGRSHFARVLREAVVPEADFKALEDSMGKGFADVIRRMVHPDPEERYASMHEAGEALMATDEYRNLFPGLTTFAAFDKAYQELAPLATQFTPRTEPYAG